MEIRESKPDDVPQIVSLLKESLGETLMPKSEAFWNWKHNMNPFGKSPVLVAVEEKELIGVRAFMNWEWRYGDKIFRAVRAVDTATHPLAQGKGIFKKLTLALLDHCRSLNYDFVYNTPNKSSMPGYIKMGWRSCGKLPISVTINNPLSLLIKKTSPPAIGQNADPSSQKTDTLDTTAFKTLLQENGRRLSEQMITNYSSDYLAWRYFTNPVAEYQTFPLYEGNQLVSVLIYRIKPGSKGNELRIVDILSAEEGAILRLLKAFKATIQSLHPKPDYMTLSGCSAARLSKLIPRVNIGPIVTFRDIHFNNFEMMNKFSVWQPSLGDLELF